MKKEPKNYAFWLSVIKDPEQAAEFMAKGNDRQKRELKRAFKYHEAQKKAAQKDLFDER